MEIEIKITAPDSLVNLIIKEFELANSGKPTPESIEKLKEKLVNDISNRIKMKVGKDIQQKVKQLFLNSKA